MCQDNPKSESSLARPHFLLFCTISDPKVSQKRKRVTNFSLFHIITWLQYTTILF